MFDTQIERDEYNAYLDDQREFYQRDRTVFCTLCGASETAPEKELRQGGWGLYKDCFCPQHESMV